MKFQEPIQHDTTMPFKHIKSIDAMKPAVLAMRCLLGAVLILLWAPNVLAQGTFVMPSGMANQASTIGDRGPFGEQPGYTFRYQQTYAPEDMPIAFGVVYITSIAFRLPNSEGSLSAVVPDMEVRLAVAPSWVNVDGQGTDRFTENLDRNVQMVFPRGSFHLAATFIPGVTTQPFAIQIPLSQPYLYDRSWGPLVLDVIEYQPVSKSARLDASANFGVDSVSSLMGASQTAVPVLGGSSHVGLVTQFGWQPVPEPSVLRLGLLTLGVIAILRPIAALASGSALRNQERGEAPLKLKS